MNHENIKVVSQVIRMLEKYIFTILNKRDVQPSVSTNKANIRKQLQE